jgi:PucR family transcriptional regulator, purine catabolism regulatory protein
MADLTVAQVLEMPVLRGAGAQVVAGRDGLTRAVRWVHSAELADIAPLLRGGDLLLSTGIALPGTGEGLSRFASSLGDSDVAGLLIELGRRWTALPAALVDACERVGLPLVALTREVRFAAIAQAVGERIVAEQLEELREAERVHETFTELSLDEAGPGQVLEAVQRLAGAAVVLESEQHHVLDYRSGSADVRPFLADWPARSRTVQLEGRTSWDAGNGWLLTRLGRRDRGWGRLVVEAPHPPPQRLVVVAERAAAALAMHRLHDRHRDSVVRRAHQELVLGLLTDPTDPDVLRRCELAGVPMARRRHVGLAVRPVVDGSVAGEALANRVEEIMAAVVHAAHQARVPALVCQIDHDVRVLLSCAATSDHVRTTEEVATRIQRTHDVVVCAGRAADRAADIDRTLREAQHVASSVRPGGRSRVVHRLEDVHLRGLLRLLGDDDRLGLFVTRELGTLKAYDAEHGTDLLGVLRALLRHPGSKSDAASSLHLSRPAFYDRLAKIERVLEESLDDPDIRTSLHVALMAEEL